MAGQSKIFVEGPDDMHVAQHLANAFSLGKIDVKPCEGIPNLLEDIRRATLASELTNLVVICDADDDVPSRWQQIRDRLKDVAILPVQPHPSGTVAQGPKMKVSVWLMPDNASPGALEQFLEALIPSGDTTYPKAKRFIDSLTATERRFLAGDAPKASLYVWLATQEDPECPYGTAIKAGYFDASSAHTFTEWLRAALA